MKKYDTRTLSPAIDQEGNPITKLPKMENLRRQKKPKIPETKVHISKR